jgi:hypothetical protein
MLGCLIRIRCVAQAVRNTRRRHFSLRQIAALSSSVQVARAQDEEQQRRRTLT